MDRYPVVAGVRELAGVRLRRQAHGLAVGVLLALGMAAAEADDGKRPVAAAVHGASAGGTSTRVEPRSRTPQAIAGKARLDSVNGYLVLEVSGTPEEMGTQHGRLLRSEVRRMVTDLIVEGEGRSRYEELLRGTREMEKYVPVEFRRELRALARAAGVDYLELMAAQLFGDVWRGMYCTSYAVFGPATVDGRCLVGRNMDYWDHGVTRYGAVLIHFRPASGLPFVTVSWAGIINGWTAMNHRGVVVANNSGYGGKSNSLKGVSTCFVLRQIAQYADSVEAGVRIIRQTPRAVGTNMIIAGGRPANAAIVEYDHASVAVRWAQDGVVLAANDFRRLYRSDGVTAEGLEPTSRYGILARLIGENLGRIDASMNFAAAPGVPIDSMNLHCALLSPDDLRFQVAMGAIPAYQQPFRRFRLTEEGIQADE